MKSKPLNDNLKAVPAVDHNMMANSTHC